MNKTKTDLFEKRKKKGNKMKKKKEDFSKK